MIGDAVLSLYKEAACKDEDPDLFFGEGSSYNYRRLIKKGKEICARCPVVERCMEFSEDLESEWGTFGGLDQEERRQLYVNYGSVRRPRGRREYNRILSELRANVSNGETSGSHQSKGFGRAT